MHNSVSYSTLKGSVHGVPKQTAGPQTVAVCELFGDTLTPVRVCLMAWTGRNFLFFFSLSLSLRHSEHTVSRCGSDGLLAREHYILVSRPGAKRSLRGCRVCVEQLLVIAPVCFVERTATRCCAKRKLPHYIIMISHSKNCRGCHHSFPIRLHFSMLGGCFFLYSKHTLGDLGEPEHFRNVFCGSLK